jgi:hypothetical protein
MWDKIKGLGSNRSDANRMGVEGVRERCTLFDSPIVAIAIIGNR